MKKDMKNRFIIIIYFFLVRAIVMHSNLQKKFRSSPRYFCIPSLYMGNYGGWTLLIIHFSIILSLFSVIFL